ncbi:hypothetical protein CN324_13885 [Bacillus anthracis]|nr:hypothetical protein CN385_02425 [Bacillus anthracis]PFF20141.1 hypothetical protein CN324_13885 [Bacillus anthracis]PGP27627.1 hypothetical protein CN994_07035 [Bacillus anthracis]
MTLICCTLTDNFVLITGDTLITSNEENYLETVRKTFKYADILIGASGSAGAINAIPIFMENYQRGTAYSHMQYVANLFSDSQEEVQDGRYSQFLYVSRDEEGPFFGIVDTKGDHKTLRKSTDEPSLIWKGIGQPNEDILQSCIVNSGSADLDLDTAKEIHENYIIKVSEVSNGVNSEVIHEYLIF